MKLLYADDNLLPVSNRDYVTENECGSYNNAAKRRKRFVRPKADGKTIQGTAD